MSAETSREATFTKAQRCPYCHESIAVDEEAWVACEQCLGRHHQSCWDEAGSCSACSHTHGLANQHATEPRLDLAPLTDEVSQPGVDLGAAAPPASPMEHRRATARLFEEDDERNQVWSALPLTPLTMGLKPLARAEAALDERRRAGTAKLRAETSDLPPDLRAQVDEACVRAGATAGGVSWGVRRILVPVVMLVGWVATWCGGALTVLGEGSAAERSSLWALGCSIASAAMLTWLHMFRESVRQQERDQLFVQLVHRAVPSAAAKELLQTRRDSWRSHGIAHVLLTASSLVLLLITLGLESRGAYPLPPASVALFLASLSLPLAFLVLRRRNRNEEQSEEFLRLYGPAGERSKGGAN